MGNPILNSRTQWLTLGELSRLTKIPRDTLRTACDVGRLPSQRSAKGYRLIPVSVVERLRKRGLKVFPLPDSSSDATEDDHSRRTVAAERLGLLGQPSRKLQRLKEQAEAERMRLDRERTTWDLERVKRDREEERRGLAEAEREARERQEAEEQEIRLERVRAAEAEQRRKWFDEQARFAAGELGRQVFRESLDVGNDPQALAETLCDCLTEALRDSGPQSKSWELSKARECAVSKVLQPWRDRKRHRQVVDFALSSVAPHLRELKDKGWISVPCEDVHLLADQLEGPMRAILEAQVELRNLAEEQAKELLYDAIDRRLRII